MSELESTSQEDWSAGAAYVDGGIVPLRDAKIPVTDWGYRRSDVIYDVVGVYFGAFFRLDDHLRRSRASMTKMRLRPKESDEEIAGILGRLVRLTGLRESYVAMDCLRGRPSIGAPYHPARSRNHLICFATPWVWVFSPEQQARGVHAIVADTPRIPPESVDPTANDFHWGDLTRAAFEAHDQRAETAILLDRDGFVTEGPGFSFAVIEGTVTCPPRGALEGITRLSVNELCEELEILWLIRPIARAELEGVDEIFLSTTAGVVMPVSRSGARILGNDRPGVISARLREAFSERRRTGWHATPVDYRL